MGVKMNEKGNIPITILAIAVIALCGLAIYTFISSTNHAINSLTGISLMEKMNSQIEKNYFYGIPSGTEVSSYAGNINSAIDYAKQNQIVNRTCNCGSNCQDYANWIVKSSSDNGIPNPSLLLSLMMQESDCTSNAFSGSSVGIMQINLIHCGEYGLSSDKEKCRDELINNVRLNIETGAKILKEKYNSYKDGKIFQGCSNRNIFYSGWDAAMRGYNGWGCGEDASGNSLYAQDNYVEEVTERYNQLQQVGNYLEEKQSQVFLFWKKEVLLFSAEYKFKPQ